MSFTTVLTAPAVAVAGLVADSNPVGKQSYPCSEPIPFGRFVEIVNGSVRLCQTAAAIGAVKGVSVRPHVKDPLVTTDATSNASGYNTGEMVPVLFRGKIWMESNGTAPADGATLNVSSASTDGSNNARHRGKATTTTANATAGTEIYALGGVKADSIGVTAPSGLVLASINLP